MKYKCEVCKREYHIRDSLISHMMREHTLEIFDDTQEGK